VFIGLEEMNNFDMRIGGEVNSPSNLNTKGSDFNRKVVILFI
jgi:hypothetical protein